MRGKQARGDMPSGLCFFTVPPEDSNVDTRLRSVSKGFASVWRHTEMPAHDSAHQLRTVRILGTSWAHRCPFGTDWARGTGIVACLMIFAGTYLLGTPGFRGRRGIFNPQPGHRASLSERGVRQRGHFRCAFSASMRSTLPHRLHRLHP